MKGKDLMKFKKINVEGELAGEVWVLFQTRKISSFGRWVKVLKSGRQEIKDAYRYQAIFYNDEAGQRHKIGLGNALLQVFKPLKDQSKYDTYEVAHLDLDPSNFNIENLSWCKSKHALYTHAYKVMKQKGIKKIRRKKFA